MGDKGKGYHGHSREHAMNRKGIRTSGRRKLIKYPREVKNIKEFFDYGKLYDTETLILIPSHRMSKKEAIWDIEEYIEWLKGESSFGEDVRLVVYLKDEATTVQFDMEDFDIEKNKFVSTEKFNQKRIERSFNRNNIENVVKIDAWGTWDLNGELIHTWEFEDIFDAIEVSKRQQETFNDFYKGKKALRLNDMEWVEITHPKQFKELNASGISEQRWIRGKKWRLFSPKVDKASARELANVLMFKGFRTKILQTEDIQHPYGVYIRSAGEKEDR